jgi:hypothetical protein
MAVSEPAERPGKPRVTFNCSCGHVLGQIKRNARGAAYLLVSETPYISMNDGKVGCDSCGKVTSWYASTHLLNEIVKRRTGKDISST